MTAGARRLAAWAELLRVSALFTVPGDAVAGAASIGVRPNRGTALAVGASLCLYEAGMALNDWSDRAEDAVDRPHRPIPSGRITPGAALAASGALTAAGLALAAGAGRRALGVATGLAATIWAYDLHLKHTAAAPAAMATARALDLLLGATATGARAEHLFPHHAAPSRKPPSPAGLDGAEVGSRSRGAERSLLAHPARPALEDRGSGRSPAFGGAAKRHSAALAAAAVLGAHTYAVTAVSRRETQGGSTAAPLAALAATAVLAVWAARACHEDPGPRLPTCRSGESTQPGRGWAGLPPWTASAHQRDVGAGSLTNGSNASAGHRRRPLAPATSQRYADPPRHHADRPLPAAVGAPAYTPAPALASQRAIRVVTRLTAPATLAAIAYFRTAAKPLLHAALNPSPPLTQRAVGGGIRAMIPLQAALAARSGAAGAGAALMGLVPIARKLSRKVSPT
ncbi:SCO3242 family prenyltransferase [Streptomyces flavidovirens]|uniref:SCO3242 family prenyltransferase n=1 Tax=Streptomyces flavidovirens TaxID=67298 RepID=UPI000424E489|nr:UbiA family prenyltransferase [Streptomyces flavidovirens]